MNVLSLFDGISCGYLALERAGIHVDNYIASEIDKHAINISKKHYPQIIRFGDVREIKGSDISKICNIDLMIGGSPCQSFSRSGDNSGFDGKSGLVYEYIRLLNEVNPKYFLLENVVMKNEWRDYISKCLGVNPVMIDSSYFSAQKRQRYYWTNIPLDVSSIEDKKINLKDILTSCERKCISDNPVVINKNNGVLHIRNATKKGYLIANDGDAVNLEVPNSNTRRGRVSSGKTNTLNTACNYGVVINGELYELNITEYERLQTLPDGYTDGISCSQRKKVIGNGWTVDVVSFIFQGLNK